jgi:hypothetical protein
VDHHGFMDGSGLHNNTQRTFASQPAAAAEFGVQSAGLASGQEVDEPEPSAIATTLQGTRLQRLLLAARQMQQR